MPNPVEDVTPQQHAMDIAAAANQGVVPAGTSVPITTPPDSAEALGVRTSETLLRIYINKRIDNQSSFYKARVREFEANSGFMVTVGAVIMAVSATVSAVGAYASSPLLALITALLPSLAALVASFRQLYQWDKQSSLYRDAVLGLEQSRLIIPDDDVFDKRISPVLLPRLIASTEEVFTAEINQWGQIALGKDEAAQNDELNKMLRGLAEQDAIDADNAQRDQGMVNQDAESGGIGSGG